MSLQSFLGPEDTIPRLVVDDDDAAPYTTSSRGESSSARNVPSPDTTETAEQIMREMLANGLLTQDEYDEGAERLGEIQYALETALDSFETTRPHKKVTCPSIDTSIVVDVPLRLQEYEMPMSEEHRASKNWEASVERAWCKADDRGTPEAFSAIGLTHQETKCAVCENFVSRMLFADVLPLATCPEIESEINLPAIFSCDLFGGGGNLNTQMFGTISFQANSVYRDLCVQFRRDLASHMSPLQIRTFAEEIAHQARLEWRVLEIHRDPNRCFHDIVFDVASRMCTDMACCPTSLTQGCPHRNVVCEQCVSLLEKSEEVTSEPTSRLLNFKKTDSDLMKGYERWLQDDIKNVVAEIEALQKEQELIEDYFYAFKEVIKKPFAHLLTMLHPSLDCPRIRKSVNLAITAEARTVNPTCLEPKEYMWKRNFLGRQFRGKRSCLDVYKEKLHADASVKGVCDAVLRRDSLTIVPPEEIQNIGEWLKKNGPGLRVSPDTVREQATNTAKQCCEIVVEAWSTKSRGKTEAARFLSETTKKKIVEIARTYRDVIAPDLHVRAHPKELPPTNMLMRTMDERNLEVTPYLIRRLYGAASDEFKPFFTRLDEIEEETDMRLRLQSFQTLREANLVANKLKPYKTSKERWVEIKRKLNERYVWSAPSSSSSAEGTERKLREKSTDSESTQVSQSSSSSSRSFPRLFRRGGATVIVKKAFWDDLVKSWKDDKKKRDDLREFGKSAVLCAELYPEMCAIKSV